MARKIKTNRTSEEIQRQIQGLLEEKKKLPHFTKFGDNNYQRINAVIEVLEGNAKADDFYPGEEDEDEGNEYSDNTYMAALDAEMWLKGQANEDLFEN